MEHTLVLEIPDEAYRPLVKTAKRIGQTPEKVAQDWLVIAIQTMLDDPLEEFIGAFKSNIPDWAEQHDKYLGQALMNEMLPQENDDNGKG